MERVSAGNILGGPRSKKRGQSFNLPRKAAIKSMRVKGRVTGGRNQTTGKRKSNFLFKMCTKRRHRTTEKASKEKRCTHKKHLKGVRDKVGGMDSATRGKKKTRRRRH